MMYLDVSTSQSIGGRLMTQYFPSFNGCQKGCLTIDYIMCGSGPKSLYLIQQDKDNYCVWQSKNDEFENSGWKSSSITINLSRGPPRFFIEAHVNPYQYGAIAISNMSFRYGECSQYSTQNSDYCDLD